jgi:crotonobetainyl-CoA:carnitine CoA-transferase CaiB-like acyl-CoA transferase
VAIAVFDDAEWKALVGEIGDPAWAADARFATMADRVAHQDALDAFLAEWTSSRDRHEIMHRLQAAGVRAGAVQDARDVNESDPQMAHRDVFFELDHPVIGEARFEGVPFTSTSFAADHWRSAPLLGEDNRYVFCELLGLDAEEVAELEATGVLT